MRRVGEDHDVGASRGPTHSTIVELDEFWCEPDPRRLEHRAAKLDALVARPRDDLRLALVLADDHAWAERRGPSVHVEHVKARRWPEGGRPLVSLGTLIAAIELQRPRAILAVADAILLAALWTASQRLDPRPLVILRWVARARVASRASLVRRLGLARHVDVVLVDDREGARQAREYGLERLVLSPLGEAERELDRLQDILAWQRAGRPIPRGFHDTLAMPRVGA